MTRSGLHVLVIIHLLVAISPAHAAAQSLLVQVDNDARIPAAAVARMEHVVAGSFLRAGVQVVWEHGEVALDDSRGMRVHVRLLSRTSAARKIAKERIANAVLGLTNRSGGRVYIFIDRLVDESFKYSRDSTQVLGLVIAHELGHMVLPAGSHSDSGVMNGRAKLRGTMPREFTTEEGEAIRTALLNLAADEQHRAEGRLTEPAGVDADRTIELEADWLARNRAAHHVSEPGQVGEADGEIERDN